MQGKSICILIVGVDNLEGGHALQLVEYFKIQRYPNQNMSKNYYYALFKNNLDKRESESIPAGIFTEFLVFLGLRGYPHRLDRAHIHGDSAVDYILAIGSKRRNPIKIPHKELNKK